MFWDGIAKGILLNVVQDKALEHEHFQYIRLISRKDTMHKWYITTNVRNYPGNYNNGQKWCKIMFHQILHVVVDVNV